MINIQDVINKENNADFASVLFLLEDDMLQSESSAYRLIFDLWYIINEPDFDDELTFTEIELETKLKSVYNVTHPLYLNSPNYLFFVGYMMLLTDWFFTGDMNLARQYLKKAHCMAPDNLLFQWGMWCDQSYQTTQSSVEYQKLCMDLNENFHLYFKENGLLERYFKSIVCNEW